MRTHVIVVGVDGSEHSKAALRWAFEEALLRGAELRVVHSWAVYPPLHPGSSVTASDWDELRVAAERSLREFVAETVPDRGGVEIATVALQTTETAARTLVGLAEGADLLVVGSRGFGGFKGLLLGSVSQQCVQHAQCPVVIVRRAQVARRGATASRRGERSQSRKEKVGWHARPAAVASRAADRRSEPPRPSV
jgi:nucleotide-binding universal stress UspA family protein